MAERIRQRLVGGNWSEEGDEGGVFPGEDSSSSASKEETAGGKTSGEGGGPNALGGRGATGGWGLRGRTLGGET